MYHDQQNAATSALLGRNFDVGQPDPRSPMITRTHASGGDAHRQRDDDQGVGTFRIPVPGGASILMKDAAGTSMSLNLGIDPSSGTPILSGRAIDAHGGVLDVHPCSCNDPVSPRHRRPGSPEHSCGGAHLRDHSHLYSSPKSPFGARRGKGPIPTTTPLIVVQPLHSSLTPSYSHIEPQGRDYEPPVPDTSVDALRSPFTPTPASVRQRSQSPGNDSHDAFYTPPMGPEDTSNPCNTILPPASSPDLPSRSRHVALKLHTMPEQSLFEPDPDTPLVQSPASDGARSDISGPSALGPLLSLPSTPSHIASERSIRTVTPHSHPVQDVQLHPEEQLHPEPTVNAPWTIFHGSASSQGSGGSAAANSALPGPLEGPNADTPGRDGPTSIADAHATNSQGGVADLLSDLYLDSVLAEPLPPMPVARVGRDGQELRYNMATQPRFGPMQEPTNPPVVRSGNLGGIWIANVQQDRTALTLDLSLDGLGFHNLSLSVPAHFPLPPDQAPAPEVQQEPVQDREPPAVAERADQWEAESSQSVVTFGSCPSTAPPLSDLPLTPIPELLHTPTNPRMPTTGAGMPDWSSPRASPFLSERRHPQSRLPGPLDSGPIIEQLSYGEGNVGMIRTALRTITREWQNIVVMPDGVALRDIDDACATLSHTLTDLVPVIMLTWPLVRQPTLGTDGGQPLTAEFQLQLQNMGDAERKWYLKQHEFTTSLQRNLTRLALLAQRVREDPDAAYRCNAYERISQFAAKFQDIGLRLKLAHHIRVEQKYRARVRHSARRAVASPEQVSAHEYHKARLIKVREEIEGIKRTLLTLCDARPLSS